MVPQQTEQRRDPVVVAIERVLEAERSAEGKLRDCRRQAEALAAIARERAAAITRRADIRISKLHTAYFNKVTADLAMLSDRPISAPEATDVTIDDARLAEAAERLAAKLTGDT